MAKRLNFDKKIMPLTVQGADFRKLSSSTAKKTTMRNKNKKLNPISNMSNKISVTFKEPIPSQRDPEIRDLIRKYPKKSECID